MRSELRAVKWRQWKLHYHWEPEVNESKGALESPYLFNLVSDPKEESDVLVFNTWVLGPMERMVEDFRASCRRWPNTPAGLVD
jgi:arylsulfatase